MDNESNPWKDKIVYLAGTLLLGVSAWLISTTYQIQVDTQLIKEKLDRVYEEDCPYCIHSAHSSIGAHPLLAPTIKHSHRHIGDEIIIVNE